MTILNQICEEDFLGCFYGFRPGRSQHQALDALWLGIMWKKVNWILDADRCRRFYHEKLGRPSLAPGIYFRLMMIGFFEGLDSEQGVTWRVADSPTLRQFLRIGLNEQTLDQVTISRTRRLIGAAAHQQVFGWVLRRLALWWIDESQNDRNRFDHAGSQRGDEVVCGETRSRS